MTEVPPPPGWYPDPQSVGSLRYWDGRTWTDHRAPAAGPPAVAPDRPSGLPPLATFGPRAAAAVIDWLVISIPITVVFVAGFVLLLGVTGTAFSTLGDPDPAIGAGAGIGLLVGFVVLLVVSVAIPILYATGFEGGPAGQTIGKWIVDIRVVDGATAGRVRPSRAFLRTIIKQFASGAVLYLGYLWMLWDDQNRTWHDLVADTRVVSSAGPKPSFGQLLRSWSLRSTA